MARCIICDYFFQPDGQYNAGDLPSCPVCRVRTTPSARTGFLRGRRIEYSYMDSD